MAENWYVRSPEGDRGPFEFSEILKLVRSGDLGSEDEIKCSLDGHWIKVHQIDLNAAEGSGHVEALVKASQPLRPGPAPAPSPKPPPARLASFFQDITDRLSPRFVWPIVIIIAWLGINYVVLHLLSPSQIEVEYIEQFVAIGDKLSRHRDGEAQATDWEGFSARSLETVTRIVAQLERSASADQPVRRHLLWAGKDCLMPGLSNPQAFTPELQQRFQMHVQQALIAVNGQVGR